MQDGGKEKEVVERYGPNGTGSKKVYKLECGGGF
jgi:hypothetical protein